MILDLATCSPDNRDISSTSCQDTMLPFCLGEDLETNDKVGFPVGCKLY